MHVPNDSSPLDCQATLEHQQKTFAYCSLPKAESAGLPGISRLPYALKILLENLLRHQDSGAVSGSDLQAFVDWLDHTSAKHEIAYHPSRVLMQDFTGVPAVVDLAAMRDAVVALGGDASRINPLCPVDLVIDHSLSIEKWHDTNALQDNIDIEMQRNRERYAFLRWGQQAFDNFRVVPPGMGICHQVNLEYLAQVVWAKQDEPNALYPDTVVGTDSHTTMINGLGVLGWGVGGIEAEAAMLGQPISMLIPEVIGFELKGQLREGVTATDLVLTCAQMLREKGVVGKFVEYYGSGLKDLPLADRATIANMAPDYGATCGIFPIDAETLRYLRLTGRDETQVELIEAYAKAQGLWADDTQVATYTDKLHLDLSTVEPSLAGPKRPQDRVSLSQLPRTMETVLADANLDPAQTVPCDDFDMHHGDVVIAAITSCTNTSNPGVMIAAGLVAQKAREKGLQIKPWVKTSLAPGSTVVRAYLEKTGLLNELEALGFYLVGFGCTTCIGNSGPLDEPVQTAITQNNLNVCGVLSGNRNFEGRIHPLVKSNFLASPPLVVAYALAGTTLTDLSSDPVGTDAAGNPVMLKDIWPSNQEIADRMTKIDNALFQAEYSHVFEGTKEWQAIPVTESERYTWDDKSTYVQNPPYFANMTKATAPTEDIANARVLALLGDSITTDHISPASRILPNSVAGEYLQAEGVATDLLNSFGSRRGNHEVMMRGTFSNIRLRNEILDGIEGGMTKYWPTSKIMPIYDAAMQYIADQTPTVVIAGKEYGTGSSRDWAAKGTVLLGIKAVVAESFERIHRSNLIGMGVLPLQFADNVNRHTLQLKGDETLTLSGLADTLQPGARLAVTLKRADGTEDSFAVLCRIDTQNELQYYQHGGILQYVLRQLSQ